MERKNKKQPKIIIKPGLKIEKPSAKQPSLKTNMTRRNEDYVKVLSEIEFIKMKRGDFMSAKRYKNAQEAILKISDDITSPKDLEKIKFIGKKMLEVLNEYHSTGKVEYLEKEKKNPVNIFANIYGVGYVNAEKIVNSGIKTIEELREKQDEILNDKQKIGLQYYEDILERIPREEIESYDLAFKEVFDSLNSPSSAYEIVGSYRRGASNSGDIDIIITDHKNRISVFKQFIDALQERGIILHRLTDGKSKVLVIGKLGENPARRIDFLYTPPEEYAFAVLYFTGSKGFNTAMRQRALDIGYSLNEHGLYEMKSGIKGKKLNLVFEKEHDIFEFLNMEYKNPEDRIDSRSVVLKSDVSEPEEVLKVKKNLENPVVVKKPLKIKKKKTLKKRPEVPKKSYDDRITEFRKRGLDYLKSLEKEELEEIIIESNNRYHNNTGENMLSDGEYDIIKEYLEKRDPENVVIKEVGAPIKRDKVKLPFEMASMDKIKPETNALEKWLKKYNEPSNYVISSKLDGVSGLYVNKDGDTKLYTRGNGLFGQDISHILPFMKLPKREGLVVRGEFIVSKENFEKHYKGVSSNPRNLVGGIINKKAASQKDLAHLDFVVYEVIEPVMKPSEQVDLLKTLQFNVVLNFQESNLTNELLSQKLVEGREMYQYEMDGIVIYHDKIYERSSGNPDHAFAFKMVLSDQMAEAKVVDIIWSPSKDGYLKPRVRIEPIELNGVTIEYATGFNGSFIEQNKIGIGSVIQIIRSGDVIPHIMKVIVPAAMPKMPDEDYIWNKTHVDIILKDVDTNPVVMEKKITLFFKNLDIGGVGSGNVKRLIKAKYDTIPKILAMDEKEYLTVEGFKAKLANKIYTNIQKRIEESSLVLLMKASGIFGRGLGERKIQPILDAHPDILVSDETSEEKLEKVKSVKGMAEKTAKAFVDKIEPFIAFMEQSKLTSKLQIEKKEEVVYDKEHPLFEKRIVLTEIKGKELERFIVSKGGEVGKNVSKKTFLVVKKDEMTDTEKANAAKLLGIKTMTEAEFRKEYNI